MINAAHMQLFEATNMKRFVYVATYDKQDAEALARLHTGKPMPTVGIVPESAAKTLLIGNDNLATLFMKKRYPGVIHECTTQRTP